MDRRTLTGCLVFLLCFALVSTATATVYYVDSAGGNDNNSGTSTGSAWQSLTKVSATTFAPGDQILLKCGSVWAGQQLYPKGSGSSGSPIVITSYSTGAKPLANCNGAFLDAVYLYNQAYWEINNLEITNTAASPMVGGHGVYVKAVDAGTVNHIYLKNLTIHDVNGDLNSGGDHGKNNGGILVEAGGTVRTHFNDVLIEGNSVYHVDTTAIRTWSAWPSCGCQTWEPVTNLVIRNNTVDDLGGDGIVACHAQSPLMEYNVASHCQARNCTRPNVAIWTWDCRDAVLQFNEAYATYKGDGDGCGYDVDSWNQRAIVQCNYSHDNEGGFMLVMSCAPDPAQCLDTVDTVIRYNISQHDGLSNEHMIRVANSVYNTQFYNNVFYLGADQARVDVNYHSGSSYQHGIYYYNNIFYILESGATYGSGGIYDYNVFYGVHPSDEPTDAHKLTSNPMLVNPGGAGIGRSTCTAYQIQSGSPCINSGMSVPNCGTQDFFGNPMPVGATDRGAHEYQGGGGSPPVANFTGNPTSGTAPLNVAFTDSSTNNPTSWSWVFGDGGTSAAQNPSHSYAAGTYTVTLTAANAYGSDGETKTNYITATSGGSAPTFVAAGNVAAGTADITPALPAGIAGNDILLLFVETANQISSIINQNGGTWTQVTGSPQGYGAAAASNAVRITVFWSRYNGTQGAPTVGDSGNHQLARIIALRGATTGGDPCNVTAGGTESTVDTSGAIPGATTTVANTLVVAAITTSLPDANGTSNFSAWANADLTGLAERTDNVSNAGNGGGLAVATGVKATAGAYASTAVTCGTATTKAMLSLAIRP
jgi:PKD repeat protein